MRKKHLIVAAAVLAAITTATPSVFAAEEATQETEMLLTVGESDTVDGEDATEETAEATEESEAAADEIVETESPEEESTEIEEAAVLNQHLGDITYEKGELNESGWKSEYLNMQFVPGEGILMGVSENETLQKYHNRNGEENAVAINELVAYTEDKQSFVQLMVEVNPNAETNEDILTRLAANEKLEDMTDMRIVEIGGKEFLSTTGELEDDHYFLAVSTEQDGVAIAIKMKYANAMRKRVLINSFETVEEAEEATEEASEATTEAVIEEPTEEVPEQVTMPEEFDEVSTEVQAEGDGEGNEAADGQ